MTPEKPSYASSHFLSLPSGQAMITDQGEGPALITIHGLPGSIRDMRWMASCLEGPIRMIRVDLPGFGQTPLATMPDPRPQKRAEFILQIADELGISRFAVLGHSMGGPVAIHLAANYPERVTGLVLLASVGLRPHQFLRYNPTIRPVTRMLKWIPGASTLMLPMIRQAFLQAGFSEKLTLEECHHCLRCTTAHSFRALREAVKRLKTPTFAAWAEDDKMIEAAIFEELAAACPEGPRHAFPKGGHNIQKSQAVELCDTLLPWLKALPK